MYVLYTIVWPKIRIILVALQMIYCSMWFLNAYEEIITGLRSSSSKAQKKNSRLEDKCSMFEVHQNYQIPR